MIHLFEDSPDTSLSLLYQHAYTGTDTVIKYSRGATKLINCLCELQSEKVAVYVDVIPDNENTVFTYNRLVAYAQGHIGRIFVIPTLSAEYYFIRSVSSLLGSFLPEGELARCIAIKDWRSSTLLEDSADLEFAGSFEKFCKLLLIKAAPSCMKITGVPKCGASGDFYTADCNWDACELNCESSLLEKSLHYVREYPVFPSLGARGGGLYNLSSENIVLASHVLCSLHTALRGMFLPHADKALDLLRLYSLGPEEYAREYKRYKLKKFSGSVPPADYKKGIDLK